MNKKIFIPIAIAAFLALSFTSIRDKIPSWVMDYQINFAAHDYGIQLPDSSKFFNPTLGKLCRDSFYTTPELCLKAQAVALMTEQTSYGYDWEGVSVGYGFMPLCGNIWERITLNYVPAEAKKYLFDPLIKNRAAQTKLYKWAKPTIIAAWASKEDTAQALDMLAIYKCQQYLSQYTIQKEKIRENVQKELTDNYNGEEYKYTVGFTSLDWKGRQDHDAKLYCFWHRRIMEYAKTGNGFSVDDARHWTNVAFEDMHANAKPETLKIFEIWKAGWLKKQ